MTFDDVEGVIGIINVQGCGWAKQPLTHVTEPSAVTNPSAFSNQIMLYIQYTLCKFPYALSLAFLE